MTSSSPLVSFFSLGLAVLLTLGGCKVGPDFTKPEVAINQTWYPKGDPRLATQTAADTQWWKLFNDPALDRLVDLAYKQDLPL